MVVSYRDDGWLEIPHNLRKVGAYAEFVDDDGCGGQIIYVGPDPKIADSTETMDRLSNVLASATDADPTNPAEASPTMLLRHQPRLTPG